ncbi:MAG: hypothetical protein QGG64_26035 [Candidatus Latescibacteria bacterium]|jgi:hydroxymethylpyrimidine pyrophosphatase-like HAD family hydrolase|nr:hypothetical protein [Candidatus Latescibacterota bacterium]
MNLAIFDIDGTLLQTNKVDGTCFAQTKETSMIRNYAKRVAL